MDNLRFYGEDVTRSHHTGPTQFIHAQADRAFGEIQSMYKQPHGHRRGVPTAGDQAFENCSLSGFWTEMKHLRVKLVGELDELLLRYFQRFRFEPITYF